MHTHIYSLAHSHSIKTLTLAHTDTFHSLLTLSVIHSLTHTHTLAPNVLPIDPSSS